MYEVPSSGSWMRCQVVARVECAKWQLVYEVPSGGLCRRCQVAACVGGAK